MEDKQKSDRLLSKVLDGRTLGFDESHELLTYLLTSTNDTSKQFADYLLAIHKRGETYEEIRALVELTKEVSLPINIEAGDSTIIDVSGTGGSSIKTINVSTISAIALAALGYMVPKQSNFAGTGITGSADVFQANGIDIAEINSDKLKSVLEEVGICPYFAPMLSGQLRNALGVVANYYMNNPSPVKSIFHLGAFIYSPIKMGYRVYGCYSKDHLEIISQLLYENGQTKTTVVHGHGGLPEASNFGKTTILWRDGDKTREETVGPEDFGLQRCEVEEIESLNEKKNLALFTDIISGKETGPYRDLCLANIAVALVVLGRASNLKEGADIARSAFEKGLVERKFKELVKRFDS
ncbi:MAG: anthranilate phosphoribosyltransferase [Patescibacteria group bacterium]